MSIVKIFNLFNPNVSICCSYVAKYVFCNIFPMLQKMVPISITCKIDILLLFKFLPLKIDRNFRLKLLLITEPL